MTQGRMISQNPPTSILIRRRSSQPMRLVGALVVAFALAGCSEISNPFKKAEVVTPPTGPTKVDVGKIPGNESIPVVVDDHPITSYDITQRAKLMKLANSGSDEKAAREELVDEILELEEAARFGIVVPPDQVDSAYSSVAQNLKLTSATLTQALAGEGIDANTLKRRLLAQITWQQLVAKRAQETGQIKESDVTTALLAKGDPKDLTTKEYTLQQIVFVVPSGSPTSAFDQRRREAEAFRQRFQGCDKSLAQAKPLNGVVVKEPVRRVATDFSGTEADAIKGAKGGDTLRPSQTAQGIEVIAVCTVKDVQSTAEARLDIQNQIFQKQSEGIAKDYLKALRAQATIVYR
jgi:peptidyl-prolyl cis-trans isomerase SurA